MSGHPRRTNTDTAEPASDRYRECSFDWLAAHPPVWNQLHPPVWNHLTYSHRQEYVAEDGDVWEADYTGLYVDSAPILGEAVFQQLARKNSEDWRSLFRLRGAYHDPSDPTVTKNPSTPGLWRLD